MKFWKGDIGTDKEGQCGTYETSSPPDATQTIKSEYDAYVLSLPVEDITPNTISLKDPEGTVIEYEVVG